MSGTRTLTDADVEAIAERVAQLIRRPRTTARTPAERRQPTEKAKAFVARKAREKGLR